MQTPQQYYSDSSNYGEYQYTYIKDIVDGMMLEILADDDHYLKHTKRFLLFKYAKAGVKKLSYSVSGNVQPVAYELDENLQAVLPQDYVDYTRVSVIDENGLYKPLNVNSRNDISKEYLRDSDNKIVFDSDSDEIELKGDNFNSGFTFISAHRDYCGGYFNKDFSKYSENGEFSINGGIISFSSNMVGAKIVLEYISDGVQWDTLKDEELKVHKFIEEPLEDFIYLKAIEKKRNVSAAEKVRALNRFNKTLHAAKKYRANFNLEEISKAMRGAKVWNKF